MEAWTVRLRCLAVAAATLLITGPLLGISRSPAAAAGPAPKTKVIIFLPYVDGHIKPGMIVAHRASGDCWSTSLATVRRDAWRCMSGNTIYDPCFSPKSGAKMVVCPTDVFNHKLIVLTLAKPLPKLDSVDPTAKQLRPPDLEPWFLRLSDGTNCWFVVGATFSIGEHRANYECGERWIIGYPIEKKPQWWVAKLVKGEGATTAHELGVTTAFL